MRIHRKGAVPAAAALVAVAIPVGAVAGTGGSSAAKPNGKLLFVRYCAVCHTLKAAGAKGKAGPNLDRMGPSKAVVVRRVTRGSGGMPSFGKRLTTRQIDAVATFVANAT